MKEVTEEGWRYWEYCHNEGRQKENESEHKRRFRALLSFSFSFSFQFEFSERRGIKNKDSPPDTAINLVQRQFLISSPFWGSVCAPSALVAWWGLRSRFNTGSTSRQLFVVL